MWLGLYFINKITPTFIVFNGIIKPVKINCCTSKWIASSFQCWQLWECATCHLGSAGIETLSQDSVWWKLSIEAFCVIPREVCLKWVQKINLGRWTLTSPWCSMALKTDHLKDRYFKETVTLIVRVAQILNGLPLIILTPCSATMYTHLYSMSNLKIFIHYRALVWEKYCSFVITNIY